MQILAIAMLAFILTGITMTRAAIGPAPTPTTRMVNSTGSGGAFTTIQAAIDAAGSGDTIQVAS